MGQIPCTRVQRLTDGTDTLHKDTEIDPRQGDHKVKRNDIICLTFSWIKRIILIHEDIDIARYECKIIIINFTHVVNTSCLKLGASIYINMFRLSILYRKSYSRVFCETSFYVKLKTFQMCTRYLKFSASKACVLVNLL